MHEIGETFIKEFRSYFGLRLVSSLWKSALEDSIVRKEAWGFTLTPANSKDPLINDLSLLTTKLAFKQWSEEQGDQITNTFSTNTFNNLVTLQLEPTVQFDLSEILDKYPKVSRLFLGGTHVHSNSKGFRLFEGNPKIVEILERLGIKHPKNLRQLSLQGNNLQDNAMVYFLQKGQDGYFKELESLKLSDNKFSPQSLETIRTLLSAEALPALKTLNLNYNNLKSPIDYCKQLEGEDVCLEAERIIKEIAEKFHGLTTIRVAGCGLDKLYLKRCNEENGKKIQYTMKTAHDSELAEELNLSPKIVASDGEESESERESDDSDGEGCRIQ